MSLLAIVIGAQSPAFIGVQTQAGKRLVKGRNFLGGTKNGPLRNWGDISK
jgi:hypothetical protein